MNPSDSTENSRLERLRRGLYSRKTPDIMDEGRSEVKSPKFEAPLNWQDEGQSKFDEIAARVAHSAGRHHSLAKKFFFISSVIFVLSLGVAAFVFFGGMNVISSKNVDIKVVGPVSVAGGTESSFDIVVLNKNSTDLESVKLVIDYPTGVRKFSDSPEDIASERFDLGNIKSGKEATQNIRIFIFGEKEEVKSFKVTADYKVKNSNASFYKEKLYDLSISSSPIILNATYPKEVNSNQEITFSLEAVSNSSDPIKDFLVKAEYPFGFSFKKADPAPAYGNDTWRFSNLKSGDKRTIKIIGNIIGQDNEERVFRISAGTPNQDDPRKIGAVLLSSDESITIKKPFIGLDFKIAGSGEDYVAKGSNSIPSILRVQNNLPEKIYNSVVEVSFSGSAFSGKGINVNQNGFFRSVDNTIVWDKRSLDNLSEMQPGDSSELSFSINPLSYASIAKDSNPEILVHIKAVAERILESGSVERITSNEDRTIRLSSDLFINQRVVRKDGGISNSGPIPPKPNQKTTYTIIWSITNSFNNVSNVSVRAILPQYVEWTGAISPSGTNILFNPDSHEVIWNVGALSAGTGFNSSPKEVAFQISFLPSTSQTGTSPDLIGQASINGVDKVTSTQIDNSVPSANTKFSTDSSYHSGDDRVGQ